MPSAGQRKRPPAVDLPRLIAAAGGREPLARSMAERFLADVPRYRKDLAEALAGVDAPGARMAAHRLKGMLGMLRASSAAETAGALEQALEADGQPGVWGLLAGLEAELGGVERELRTFLGGGRPPPLRREGVEELRAGETEAD